MDTSAVKWWVDIVVMDLVQKTAMCAVLRSQGLEVQSILDHILCRRRFAVPAGVDVFSFPIWNPIVFQLHFPAFGAALTVFAQEHPSSLHPDVVVFHEPVLLQLDLLTF